MAIVRAVKTGNWSDTTVWNTGALPTSADDVYSNTFTVTIDTSPTVLSISNASATGVTAGGQFAPTTGITLTCTATNGVVQSNSTGTNCFLSTLTSGQSCRLNANCTGAVFGGNGVYSVVHSGAGTLSIVGTCSNAGANNTGAGTMNIIGNCIGVGANNNCGALNTGTGAVNITGNCVGGANSGTIGALNGSSGTMNITGNCTGGTQASANGARNSSTGLMTIAGTAIGSASAEGVNNLSTGVLNHVGSVQAGSVSGLTGSYTGVTTLTGPFLTTSSGINPVNAGRWFWQNTTPPATYYQIRSANLSVIRPLYTADSVGGNPAVGDVRSGTVYGPANELTGTCAVPGASSVLSGVAVDNTTGTATISAASIRAAIGLASANLDTQLAAIPTTAAPSAATIASTVWAAATRTLTTTIPSASDVASAVWGVATSVLTGAGTIGKLLADNINAAISNAVADSSGVTTLLSRLTSTRATGLDNLDAAVSSRLAPGGTLNRVDNLTNSPTVDVPTVEEIAVEVWSTTVREVTGGTVDNVTNSTPVDATEIAEAVRTELTPELDRVANAATTQEVGDIVEGALALPET
jgi:hypothetical protein